MLAGISKIEGNELGIFERCTWCEMNYMTIKFKHNKDVECNKKILNITFTQKPKKYLTNIRYVEVY